MISSSDGDSHLIAHTASLLGVIPNIFASFACVIFDLAISASKIPERSFFFKGYQFPLCARCTGITIGHLIAFIAAPFHTFHRSILILMLPLAIDGTVQYFTRYESNNRKRFISGLLYGFAFTSTVLCFIKSILTNKNRPGIP